MSAEAFEKTSIVDPISPTDIYLMALADDSPLFRLIYDIVYPTKFDEHANTCREGMKNQTPVNMAIVKCFSTVFMVCKVMRNASSQSKNAQDLNKFRSFLDIQLMINHKNESAHRSLLSPFHLCSGTKVVGDRLTTLKEGKESVQVGNKWDPRSVVVM